MFSDQESSTQGARPPFALSDVCLRRLRAVVEAHALSLVQKFYDVLLQDAAAAAFLSEQVVEVRLRHSLKEWLVDLFGEIEKVEEFVDRQRRIGEVHARIKIPFRIVLAGAALLKREMSLIVACSDLDRDDLASTLIALDAQMDWAMGLMSEAYMQGSVRRAQIDEAFRLFAVGQDMSLERERQLAALMDWLQSVLFPLLVQNANKDLARLSSATFGLWFHHRAGLMFPRSPGLDAIEGNMRLIDQVLLPQIQEAHQTDPVALDQGLSRLQKHVEEIKFVLGDLFQSAASIEGGRDPLTRVLNRRFLPTILGREISISTQTGTPLTLLMVDVDHFKQINDRWGHNVGDLVLQQVAEVIMAAVRVNDFVFRYGGEEFLIALVETDTNEGYEIAERVRTQLAERQLRLDDADNVQVTASIGIAGFRGHPDYMHLVKAADRALYDAKREGRNQSVVARDT